MTKVSKDSMSDHKTEYYQLNAKLCRLIEAHPCMYDRSAPNYMKKDYVDRVWAKISAEVNDTVGSCKERWRNIRTAYARSVNIYKTPSGPNRHKRYYLHDELQFLTKHIGPGLPSLRILTPTELDENLESSLQSVDQTDDNCTYEITLDSSSSPPLVREKTQEEKRVPISEPEPEPETEPEQEPEPEPDPGTEPDPSETEPNYVEQSNQAKKPRRNISEEFPTTSKPQNRDPDSEFLNSLLPEIKIMNSRQKILFKAKIFLALEEVLSDSKDFPQKEKPMLVSKSSFRIPPTRRALARRFFGNKSSFDRRPPGQSTQTGRVPIMVQLAKSHNQNVSIKKENESVEVED